MSLAEGIARQLARPEGLAGRLLGEAMDVVNRRPLRLALDALAPRAGERVLDAGCGTGAAMAAIHARAPCLLTGADRSATMLDVARRRVPGEAEWLFADLAALPVADGSFDAVLALNVLYFDGEDHAMVRELGRVLRPGGRPVAYVTARASMERWAFVRAGRHRLYDAAGLGAAFVAGGFAEPAVSVQETRVAGPVRGLVARAVKAAAPQ